MAVEVIVILHNIRSLHNVGSIFRTADAAGVGKIYLCGITPMPIDRFGKVRPQFAKVSLGAEKFVAWEYVRNAASVIKKLKSPPAGGGYKIFAVEQAKKSVPYVL
jgi:23S rRNA (guanosine2251-2'-O)-methyltransferase